MAKKSGGESMAAMSGFKRKEESDPFMEKYGYYTGEVCSDYDTLKRAMDIKKDPKKMAAIKDYAEQEIDTAGDVVEVVEAKKKEGPKNKGTEVFNDSSRNDYDSNREDYEA